MRNKKISLGFLLYMGLGMAGLQAQEITMVTGGNASISAGVVSFSIGQLVYLTYPKTDSSKARNNPQHIDIVAVNGIEETKGITLHCPLYPDTDPDSLMLKVENFNINNLSYQLYSTEGILLENKDVESNITAIKMKNLAPATYFLKLIHSPYTAFLREIKTFKITTK